VPGAASMGWLLSSVGGLIAVAAVVALMLVLVLFGQGKGK